jgi:hypothetical protein
MNKLYIFICAIVLSGCHQYSLEEIEKARAYCEAHNTKLYVRLNGMQEVRRIECVSSEEAVFEIPEEALK